MKLTDVIEIWTILHKKDTGELYYTDFMDAIEDVLGIEDDLPKTPEMLASQGGNE